MKSYKEFISDGKESVKAIKEEVEEKPKSRVDRDIERTNKQLKDLSDKNKDDKSSKTSIDIIKLRDKKAKLDVDKAKEKLSATESLRTFTQYVAEAQQSPKVIIARNPSKNYVYGDKQIGLIRLKNRSEIGRTLIRASSADIKTYGKGTCRIETQATKADGKEASIIKIDPYKGKIQWLKDYPGDGKLFERGTNFRELIMQGKDSEDFSKWVKNLGY